MKLPRSYYNLISFIGSAIAAVSFFMIGYLFIVGFFFEKSNSYLGLFTYIILPAVFVFGLLLIPIGMIIERRKRNKSEKEYLEYNWPILDFNQAKYRNAFTIFGIGTIFFLLLTGLGSYEAFHYSESVQFCGTLCHEVMEPEYVAYQNSPHAKVACVACHVGSGASWYLRSKLSGLRQVYAVLTDDFSRPIETPLENLRPAQETCEQCHWPQKFYSRQLVNEKHFLTDEENTEWNISLQMKIGPENSAYGLAEGIHWHINPNVKIEYISEDGKRNKIPWVRYTNLETGEVTIYQDSGNPLDEEKIKTETTRVMDCMDCHNRPSHHYYTPQEFIDFGLISGEIPKELPSIKKVAMDLFAQKYDTKESAIKNIEEYTTNFYAELIPEQTVEQKALIVKAIEGIKTEFNKNIFPNMGVSWDAYPSHIGHKTYEGCFRCHNGNHSSENGKVIQRDCDLCHTIVLQGKSGEEKFSPLNKSLEYIHPVDIDEAWKEGACSDCHRNLY